MLFRAPESTQPSILKKDRSETHLVTEVEQADGQTAEHDGKVQP